jgi:hypothetical protein
MWALNQPTGKKMKAALMGGSLCGLLGPALGVFALRVSELAHQHAGISEFLLMPLDLLFFAWPLAVVFVGAGAFVLGAIGALIIQDFSTRVVTRKALVLQAVALGLAFGSVVPVFSDAVWLGWKNIKLSTGSLFFGAVIGAVCAAATFWLLQRRGLLRFQQPRASEGA